MENTELLRVASTLQELNKFFNENHFQSQVIEYVYEFSGNHRQYVDFHFPVARQYDTLRVFDDPGEIQALMRSDITKYRGVRNYEAIWSKELKRIECVLNFLPVGTTSSNLRRLARIVTSTELADPQPEAPGTEKDVVLYDNGLRLLIGQASMEARYIAGRKVSYLSLERMERYQRFLTLKIENVDCEHEDDARRILEKLANSVFYQLDVVYGISVFLSHRKRSPYEENRPLKTIKKRSLEPGSIRLQYEYDRIPMSLYWFAQSSNTSPIFMYFALYQVLEYYFPIYAEKDTKARVQNLLRDPEFDVTKDQDVVRLLRAVRSQGANRLGDEREQLILTLRSITTGEDLLDFIDTRSHLKSYYESKDVTALSDTKLRMTDASQLLADFANRIYDIRCGIVHNKASETDSKILPMTKEADLLVYEVEVLKYLATRAINANCRPLNLNRQ